MICRNNRTADCPCTANCPRYGICCECMAHHAQSSSLPACLRFLKPKPKEEPQQRQN